MYFSGDFLKASKFSSVEKRHSTLLYSYVNSSRPTVALPILK